MIEENELSLPDKRVGILKIKVCKADSSIDLIDDATGGVVYEITSLSEAKELISKLKDFIIKNSIILKK